MLKTGTYRAENTDSIWDSYEITMSVKETEKSFIFELLKFKSRYSGAHIKMLFAKSMKCIIKKAKGGHAIQIWDDNSFTFYPYQAGIPYVFYLQEETK